MAFPFIRQIRVNDCYTYRDFNIPAELLTEFKHIILTGKNGSGKTTILNRIGFQLSQLRIGNSKRQSVAELKNRVVFPDEATRLRWKKQIQNWETIELPGVDDAEMELLIDSSKYIFSHFKANRKVDLRLVTTVLQEESFVQNLQSQTDQEKFVAEFKQYLVNKKVREAFDFMNAGNEAAQTQVSSQNRIFFDNLTQILRRVFGDPNLELIFIQEQFEFVLKLGDQRTITFNELSEGFSAFISILMDLLMRVDLMRRAQGNYELDPPGFVLIDEPETHFHLSMQYEILPLLTTLFPNIQFIIATHSPAIISSIKNAVVFDLTTKEEIAGRRSIPAVLQRIPVEFFD